MAGDRGYRFIADVKGMVPAAPGSFRVGPPTQSQLFTCTECGSVVADRAGQQLHDRWHDGQASEG